MSPVWLASAGVLGPGMPDWRSARSALSARALGADSADPEPSPGLLPANERRRASAPARWALSVGSEALLASGLAAEEVAIVFTSCGGDSQITDQICQSLAAKPPQMSPTRFHNSVHNAPAGYWSIHARSRAPSTTLCGFDRSFAVGLLEAAAQTIVEQRPVLLVAYDLPGPEPIRGLWPVARPFAAALLLAPSSVGDIALCLQIELAAGEVPLAWPEGMPADLASNPAAQALNILAMATPAGRRRVALQFQGAAHVAVEAVV